MHKIRKIHEGHSTVGEWKGNGRIVAGERHGNGSPELSLSCRYTSFSVLPFRAD
jgi:hypothetical protein